MIDDVRNSCLPRWKANKGYWSYARSMLIAPMIALASLPLIFLLIYGSFVMDLQSYVKLFLGLGVFFQVMMGSLVLTQYFSMVHKRKFRLKFLKRKRRNREYMELMGLEQISWLLTEL